MSINVIKYLCFNCNKCLSELGVNWCNDCFASAKAQHVIEERIGKLEDVVDAAKNTSTYRLGSCMSMLDNLPEGIDTSDLILYQALQKLEELE